jgi:hypothetical protein
MNALFAYLFEMDRKNKKLNPLTCEVLDLNSSACVVQ